MPLIPGAVEVVREAEKGKKRERAAACHVLSTWPNSLSPRALRRTARSLQLRARIFSVITGWLRGSGPRNIPDSDRLALPRPPNLESKYQSVQDCCQEKITKSAEVFPAGDYILWCCFGIALRDCPANLSKLFASNSL